MSKKKPGKKPTPAPKVVGGPMSIELLAKITQLMTEADLNTVDLRDGTQRIVLKRGAPVQSVTHMMGPAQPVYQPAPAPTPAAAGPAAPPPSAASDDADLVPIKSPMVGTFYSRPGPDAKAFVSTGSVVNEDTDVCIIEAMKVFNNIKAETRGVIAKVCVNDGQTVEFGQPLFLVKPS